MRCCGPLGSAMDRARALGLALVGSGGNHCAPPAGETGMTGACIGLWHRSPPVALRPLLVARRVVTFWACVRCALHRIVSAQGPWRLAEALYASDASRGPALSLSVAERLVHSSGGLTLQRHITAIVTVSDDAAAAGCGATWAFSRPAISATACRLADVER